MKKIVKITKDSTHTVDIAIKSLAPTVASEPNKYPSILAIPFLEIANTVIAIAKEPVMKTAITESL